MPFVDLNAAMRSLQQQVASGGIQQWQMDNELARLRGANLEQAKQNLAVQPIPQAAKDAELARLSSLPMDQFATATGGQPTAPVSSPTTSTAPVGPNMTSPSSPASTNFVNLNEATASLQQQVASGGIQQWQMDNELARLRGVNLERAKQDLAAQPIPQAAKDAELARLSSLPMDQFATATTGQPTAPTTPTAPAGPIDPNTIKNPNPGLTNEVGLLGGGDERVANALKAGLGIAGLGNENMTPGEGFFAFNSLGRVSDQLSPDVSDAIGRAKENSLPQNQALGTEYRTAYANAGNVDPTLTDIMGRRKAGLEGLAAPELTALREQGTEAMNRTMSTAMRQANAGNLMAGRYGNVQSAALPGIAEARSKGQANLERDILIQNVAERDKRLNEYQGLASQMDSDKFNRQRASLGDLGAFTQTQQGLDLNNLKNYQDYLQTARDDVLKRQVFNLGQLGQEKAGQIGLLFGAGQLGSGQAAQQDANSLGQQNVDAMKKYYDALLAQNQLAIEQMGMAMEGGEEGGSSGWSGGSNSGGGIGQVLGGGNSNWGG